MCDARPFGPTPEVLVHLKADATFAGYGLGTTVNWLSMR